MSRTSARLALFAAIGAIASIGVLGPAVLRWAATAEEDRATLRATGLRSYQLRMASALRGATLGAVAAFGAVGVAVVASGQFPIGVAADIEPDPGLRLDLPVLVFGGAATIVALSALFGAAASTKAPISLRRPSRLADGLQAQGVSPAIVAGVRAAVSREGRAIPAAAGVIIAIAAVVTALTYQAGLGRLLDTPSRYGWTWDAVIDGQDAGISPELVAALDAEPLVTGASTGRRSSLLRDGTAVPTFAFEPVRGGTYPTIVEGRAPRGDEEIALGGQTLDRFDAAVGDQLTFRGPDGSEIEVTVVGRTVLPLLNLGQDLSIGEGAVVDLPLVERVGGADIQIVLVDLKPATSPDELRAALEDGGLELFDVTITGPSYTADLRQYDAVRTTPLLLAALLALLGLGVLAHTVISMARRRRRELAVLRCVGFVRRDLRASVRWSALTLVGVCVMIAVPLGIVFGRALWRSFADGIGVLDDPVTPVAEIAVVVIIAIAGAARRRDHPGTARVSCAARGGAPDRVGGTRLTGARGRPCTAEPALDPCRAELRLVDGVAAATAHRRHRSAPARSGT